MKYASPRSVSNFFLIIFTYNINAGISWRKTWVTPGYPRAATRPEHHWDWLCLPVRNGNINLYMNPRKSELNAGNLEKLGQVSSVSSLLNRYFHAYQALQRLVLLHHVTPSSGRASPPPSYYLDLPALVLAGREQDTWQCPPPDSPHLALTSTTGEDTSPRSPAEGSLSSHYCPSDPRIKGWWRCGRHPAGVADRAYQHYIQQVERGR